MSTVSGGPSLPRYTTSFVGRERERTVLRTLVDSNRFVALIGPGGVGKSRLAAAVAAELAPQFDAGVVRADVGAITAPADLCVEIAGAVGMRDSGAALPAGLIDFLRDRRALVILNGCELLDSDSLLLIQDILGSTSQVSLLATSRRAMHVDGGQSMSLPPFAIPPESAFLGPTELSRVASYEAVQLFVDRARRVRPDFELTHGNASSVAGLCRRLDGLPLALELAASWVRALSVDQIVERMQSTRDFPRAGTPNVVPRHRTLRSLVAGTYELCSRDERLLWSRLTIFEGSFDLAAVETVCGGSPLDRVDLLEVIASLVDQSVVVVDEVVRRSRYRLLRISRDFAVEALADTDRHVLAERHAQHYDRVLLEFVRQLPGPGQFECVDQMRGDYPNLVEAIEFGLTDAGAARTSLRMAADLWSFWFSTGQLTEGRGVLRRVLASPFTDTHVPERVRALHINAYLCVLQGELRSAQKLLDIAETMRPPSENRLNRALGLQVAAMAAMGQELPGAASALLDEALSLSGDIDDPRARMLYMDAIGVAVLLAALGRDTDRARALGQRGLAACAECGDVMWRGYIEYALAVDHWLQGLAGVASGSAAAVLRSTSDELLMTHCTELLAWCAERQDSHETAALLFGAAGRHWRLLGGGFSGFRAVALLHESSVARTRSALGAAGFQSAYESGESLSYADVVAQIADLETPPRPLEPRIVPLTAREMQVAELVAQGRTNREIAQALTISMRTAESHVDHILTKLGLPNRTQVATWMLSRTSRQVR